MKRTNEHSYFYKLRLICDTAGRNNKFLAKATRSERSERSERNHCHVNVCNECAFGDVTWRLKEWRELDFVFLSKESNNIFFDDGKAKKVEL